ncbi:MAG: 5'-3' exonuclease H3TH domain-containing protein [Pseudomonadota bacterium]
MDRTHAGVYLVDASIYIFRGWFVWPDSITDRDGNPINAVVGFADFLLKLIETRQPSKIACAFDTSLGKSVRQSIYPEYKANRPEAPPELKYQFELCRDLVESLGIAAFASERYEADDILGTLARVSQNEDKPFVVVTADKDLTQLVGKQDFWWHFANDYWLDYRGVEKRFGVRPEQIADLLALCGDKVDNIPGVPGVGETTAARLLKKWGDIDTLYQQLERVSEMKFRGAKRVQSLLTDHRETVELARQLTPILDVPGLPAAVSELAPTGVKTEAFTRLCDQLNLSEQRQGRFVKALKARSASEN